MKHIVHISTLEAILDAAGRSGYLEWYDIAEVTKLKAEIAEFKESKPIISNFIIQSV